MALGLFYNCLWLWRRVALEMAGLLGILLTWLDWSYNYKDAQSTKSMCECELTS